MSIKFHTPVVTADGHPLGVAQKIYHADPDGIETSRFLNYLKVFDFNSGDAYYIPLEYVSTSDDIVALSINFKTIQSNSFSNTPRSIAYGSAKEEVLDAS